MGALFGIAVIGKLALFLFGQLPITEKLPEGYLKKLFSCQLCLGVWVYFILCLLYRFDLVSVFTGSYIPGLNEFISGMTLSFLVFLVSIGWKFRFSEFEVS